MDHHSRGDAAAHIRQLEQDLEAARRRAGYWRNLADSLADENRELCAMLVAATVEAALAA